MSAKDHVIGEFITGRKDILTGITVTMSGREYAVLNPLYLFNIFSRLTKTHTSSELYNLGRYYLSGVELDLKI